METKGTKLKNGGTEMRAS